MDKMHLDRLFDFDEQMWYKFAVDFIEVHRDTIKRGVGFRNNKTYKFPQYSDSYREAKKRGMTRKTNRTGSKGTKYKSLKEQSVSRQVAPPNFELTGRTISDLDVLYKSAHSVTVGWRGEFANIVAVNEDRGRYMVGSASDQEIELLIKHVERKLDSNWNRKVKDVNIRL